MKTALIALTLSTLLASGSALASNDHAGHSAGAAPIAAGAAKSVADGEVRKIDKEQGKITLKHGEIKNLDMPGMTMVFRVKDAALLDKVSEGDKVGFTADKVAGQFTVTAIERKPSN